MSWVARHWLIAVGGGILVFWIAVAVSAPVLAPFPPTATMTPFLLPGAPGPNETVFLLGTDQLGRDVLSRLLYGARTVLIYAPLATLCGYAIGIMSGLAAGYHRGWMDDLLSRTGDLVLAFPAIVLYITIVGRFGASGLNIVLAVTLASWPAIMRIVRSLVLDLRERSYVLAAKIRGEPTWRVMLVEILPNARGPLIVDFSLRLGYTTIAIGTLGFLGIGLPPPNPDWGGMINEARLYALVFPHMLLFPCLAVTSFVFGCNLLADGVREMSLRP